LATVDRRITTWLRGLVQVIAAHPSNYWVGVVTDPAVALFLLAWDVLVLDTALHVALPCVAIGAVAWTIAEYAAHRWLYHARMPLWRVGHKMHHESPELLIGLPWFAMAGPCWGVLVPRRLSPPCSRRLEWSGGVPRGLCGPRRPASFASSLGSSGCLVQKPPGTPPHPPSPSLNQLRRDDSLLGRHIRHDVPKALAAQLKRWGMLALPR